jgi:hypothetical protein
MLDQKMGKTLLGPGVVSTEQPTGAVHGGNSFLISANADITFYGFCRDS